MKIKICGIKYKENLDAIVSSNPDFLGFIFYSKSKRFMADLLSPQNLASVPKNILKVGVFVNESIDKIADFVNEFNLNGVQLHGDESPKYVKELLTKLITQNPLLTQLEAKSQKPVYIIKAFGIHKDFDFKSLNNYQDHCDYFLFDTKTPNYGGSGEQFNWEVLKQYDLDTPIILSGGLDVEDVDVVLKRDDLNIYAVDLNSKLEIEPGLKDIDKVRKAIEKVR